MFTLKIYKFSLKKVVSPCQMEEALASAIGRREYPDKHPVKTPVGDGLR